MTTMLEKMAEAFSPAYGSPGDPDLSDFRRGLRAALQAIRPTDFGDLPEAVCQAGEASGAMSYTGAHEIFAAMIDAILAEDKA